MTKTRAHGTLELAKVRGRRRRRRPPAPGAGTGAYLLAKLLGELRYAEHSCRSCGDDMRQLGPGAWWCDSCAWSGAARARRSYVGSSLWRSP